MRSFTKYLPLLALLGTVSVHAQDTTGAPPTAPTTAPAVKKQLSLAQMTEQTVAVEAQLKEDLRYLEHLRTAARKEQDVIKLSCVNDKLVQLKAQVNIFDLTRQQFDASVNDLAAARTHHATIANVGEQSKMLRGEAAGCAGVPDLYKQESKSEVTHPDFPDDPTTGDPFPDGIEPPGYASPYN